MTQIKKNQRLPEMIKNYENLCNEIANEFSKKQGLYFDYWIGDEVGEMASFSCQHYFSISDMFFDLKTEQKKGLIIKWQQDEVYFNTLRENAQPINYRAYTKGLRHKDLEQ